MEKDKNKNESNNTGENLLGTVRKEKSSGLETQNEHIPRDWLSGLGLVRRY